MRKQTAFFLALLYMFSMTEFHQLLKFPLLVDHYFEHVSKDEKVTVISFFEMHYFSDTKPDADHEKDMKLPYKTSETDHGSNPVVVAHHEYAVTSWLLSTQNHKKVFPVLDSHYLFLNFGSVWQPPKFV